jgi:mannose-6-phosphate isomerase-like protein (cupin superfamily)
MAATTTPGAVRGREEALAAFASEGCSAPRPWGNGPGDTYGVHAHGYHKVLFCLEGSITFHLSEGEMTLRAGDRLDLEPGTDHAATVGPEGCSCIEASR